MLQILKKINILPSKLKKTNFTTGAVDNIDSPVILWKKGVNLATQMVATVSGTKKSCSITYLKSRKIP